MKRQTSQQLSARRREAANLAHDLAHDLAHKGWRQAASARHLKVPPGTVSPDLAAIREIWREDPVAVALMRIKARYAHKGA
jgi:hypothetical protein